MPITTDSAPVGAVHFCPECGAVGTAPTHRWDCSQQPPCWADQIPTRAERRMVAALLARAAHRFHDASMTIDAARRQGKGWATEQAVTAAGMAAAECSQLRIDVTERAEVAAA